MSFTNAPVTRSLVLGLVVTSIAATLFDVKHYFYLLIDPHILRYNQPWRALLFQLCYTNSSEVLFAAMCLYNMRIIERIWGSRKYASFVVVAGALTTLILPILVLVLRTLTFGAFNYLPAGPTPILFAILAQYHAAVPHVYQYRLALSAAPPTDEQFVGVTFSNKSYKYFLAIQLALSQWPGSLLGAIVGWTVGYAWRTDLLPGSLTKWRVPGWLVGMRTTRRRQEFDGLRRRLEDEDATGAASGSQITQDTDAGRRRTVGQQIFDEFRGSL
ncbi:hypothetical protein PpBr36_04422 [Pyricularia pennisetigena]|uniref:hypothetical protein n=1 Tax=Pyricularia pennisetigena TaxID=1578925 RepID=UPI001151E420|nr:hypothetical protein PpBr36_04422 [Pyricularia pennisetigena]TLS26249.1 hypothetical protein PpBr36_04422 [Pyricularia pennisetigena]